MLCKLHLVIIKRFFKTKYSFSDVKYDVINLILLLKLSPICALLITFFIRKKIETLFRSLKTQKSCFQKLCTTVLMLLKANDNIL